MNRRGLPRRAVTLTAPQRTMVWQSASLLLDYPDDDLGAHLDLVRRACTRLPPSLGAPLRACADSLTSVPVDELQADYVDTFDNRRRHNLFLTYFAHGDTRKRGVALLRFKQTYLASGFDLDDTELPDHLCVVLEFAATIDQQAGCRLLLDHRAGLELLRLGLSGTGSRWAGALESVCATLPPLEGDEVEAIQRLAAQGPPEEEVGLTPYATPGFDPGPSRPADPAGGPVPLPMPSFPGGR